MTPLDKKLLRDILRMWGQAAAVALVIACGIAAYTTMRGAYESLIVAKAGYYEDYRFADVFASLKRAPESLVPRISAIEGVSTVYTSTVFEVTIDVPGLNEPATGRLVSIPESYQPALNALFIRRGRYVEPGKRDEVIVSESFAEANGLSPGNTIGAVINGKWQKLRIVGIALSPEYVYEIQGVEVVPDKKHFGVLWMSRDALGPAFNMEDAFNSVSLRLSTGANETAVITGLDRILEDYGGLGAYGREEQLSNRFLSDEISMDRITGIIVPSIFLAIAAFLIHMVLSRLVSMQRDQIAVLKAFGYTNAEVGSHYLKFALVIVFAGAIVGIFLGYWLGSGLAEMYRQFFRFPYLAFRPGLGISAAGIAISAGSACLGALSAVKSAVFLPPAAAMRPEPPPHYKEGVVERFGLQTLLYPPGRMIIRNISRRKIKTLLSMLGIALSAAILVVSFFFFDATDYLIKVQFQTAQRQDLTITFNDPRGPEAIYDASRLPGVINSEPFRTVAVRLTHGHRSKRVALTGLPLNGDLRRLVDKDLTIVKLPQDGLVLTKKLAEIITVKPGEAITVEALEGARPVRRLSVSALIDEPVGLAAYMNIDRLNRLMREGGTINGLYITADPSKEKRLFTALKQTPAVSAVAVRETMLDNFRKTIAESLMVSVAVLISFACVIAFGVVYNGARIALSERSHELASLRVQGFTLMEIAMMLLGEQAILTIVAIPFGFALGYGMCAVLTKAMETELYRLPLVISGNTLAYTFIIVIASASFSWLMVARRLKYLDLIAALKTGE